MCSTAQAYGCTVEVTFPEIICSGLLTKTVVTDVKVSWLGIPEGDDLALVLFGVELEFED